MSHHYHYVYVVKPSYHNWIHPNTSPCYQSMLVWWVRRFIERQLRNHEIYQKPVHHEVGFWSGGMITKLMNLKLLWNLFHNSLIVLDIHIIPSSEVAKCGLVSKYTLSKAFEYLYGNCKPIGQHGWCLSVSVKDGQIAWCHNGIENKVLKFHILL